MCALVRMAGGGRVDPRPGRNSDRLTRLMVPRLSTATSFVSYVKFFYSDRSRLYV